MILQKFLDENNIIHFTANEILECSHTKKYLETDIPANLMQNILPTIKVLDEVRSWYGYPIILNCTYRDKEHNAKVGGEKNSLHLSFNAIDFTIMNKENLKIIYNHIDHQDMIKHFNHLPKTGSMGLGLYFSFIHLDTRATLNKRSPARWHG